MVKKKKLKFFKIILNKIFFTELSIVLMNKRNVLKRKGLSKFSLTYTFDHSKPIKMDKTTKKAAFLPNILQIIEKLFMYMH